MQIFEWKNDNGDNLELTIKGKISKYACLIDLKKNGEMIMENKEAHISKYMSRPNQLFLRCFKDEGGVLAICVCDKEHENGMNMNENREISDWLWRNIQEHDRNALSYEFTMEHFGNWED